MSHTSRIFDSQPIKVQNLNGFDLSHMFMGTSKTGQLVPTLRKLLMPGSKISVGAAVNVELPPLATNFFGKIDFCLELFFVPCAILYGGWKQFISNQVATMFPSSQDSVLTAGGYALPVLRFGFIDEGAGNLFPTDLVTDADSYQHTNDGLSDYLGVRLGWAQTAGVAGSEYIDITMLPYLAYHKIWDVFYRNTSTTKTVFAVNPNTQYPTAAYAKNVSLVWHSFYTNGTDSQAASGTSGSVFMNTGEVTFPDGVSLLQTRQRCYSRDYFTAASIDTQQGNPGTVAMEVNLDNEVELTVPALRSVVALQRFSEHLNYDPSYRGIMRNLFGTSPSDAALDEPSYIGRLVIPVYQKSVYNQSPASAQETGNPFSGELANKGASGSFTGEGSFCKKYRIGCFGYLMGLASLVPHAVYGQGIDREMFATRIGDYPFPDLQTVGMDGIRLCEIYGDTEYSNMLNDFAYIGRYSWMKYICDHVSGELRPGRSLESFVLQRVFSNDPEFGTDFVTIKQTDLDGVFGTSVDVSNFSCWFEIYWEFKVVQPLAAFCVPTLGELQDTHTIYTSQGGSKL